MGQRPFAQESQLADTVYEREQDAWELVVEALLASAWSFCSNWA